MKGHPFPDGSPVLVECGENKRQEVYRLARVITSSKGKDVGIWVYEIMVPPNVYPNIHDQQLLPFLSRNVRSLEMADVSELRCECERLRLGSGDGLAQSGRKAELMRRLSLHLEATDGYKAVRHMLMAV